MAGASLLSEINLRCQDDDGNNKNNSENENNKMNSKYLFVIFLIEFFK